MNNYSVFIPAYNAERTIGAAISSVLAQTVPCTEIVVVDDGSTDKTVEIVAACDGPIRLICQENQGPGPATNVGLKQAQYDVLTMLDSDDLWLPHKIEFQLAALNAHTHPTIVACMMRQFHHEKPDDENGQVRQGIVRSGIIFRKKVFETVGPLVDPPGRVGEFVEWLGRARSMGIRIETLPEVLALRRIIPGSLTHKRPDLISKGFLSIAHQMMLNKRNGRIDDV